MIPAWIDRRAVLVMFVWDAVVLAACAIELARMPKAGDLTVQRSWQETLVRRTPGRLAGGLGPEPSTLPCPARLKPS